MKPNAINITLPYILISLFLFFFYLLPSAQDAGLTLERNSFLGVNTTDGSHLFLFETGSTNYARLRMTNSLYNGSINERYWDIAAKIGTSNDEDQMNFYSRYYGDILTLRGNGRVGILTTAPQSALEVNGYTMLGSNAPKVKMMKLEVTTEEEDSDDCFNANISSSTQKILSIDTHLYDNETNFVFPRKYGQSSGAYYFDYYIKVSGGIYQVCIDKEGSRTKDNDYIFLITYE